MRHDSQQSTILQPDPEAKTTKNFQPARPKESSFRSAFGPQGIANDNGMKGGDLDGKRDGSQKRNKEAQKKETVVSLYGAART
jgi:hypothetical protein